MKPVMVPFLKLLTMDLTSQHLAKQREIFALHDYILPSENEMYIMTKYIEENCSFGNK